MTGMTTLRRKPTNPRRSREKHTLYSCLGSPWSSPQTREGSQTGGWGYLQKRNTRDIISDLDRSHNREGHDKILARHPGYIVVCLPGPLGRGRVHRDLTRRPLTPFLLKQGAEGKKMIEKKIGELKKNAGGRPLGRSDFEDNVAKKSRPSGGRTGVSPGSPT